MIKALTEEEMVRILERFQKYELTDFYYDKDMGLLKLVCPNLMDMCDRTEKDNIAAQGGQSMDLLLSYWDRKSKDLAQYGK